MSYHQFLHLFIYLLSQLQNSIWIKIRAFTYRIRTVCKWPIFNRICQFSNWSNQWQNHRILIPKRVLQLAFLPTLLSCSAVALPQEENLYIEQLDNGVTVWVRENPLPKHAVAFRVIWNRQDMEKVYALNCSSEDLDEVGDFFEFCQGKIDCSSDQIVVIAVGDMQREEMVLLIKRSFQHLLKQGNVLTKESITIDPEPEAAETHFTLLYPMRLEKPQTTDDLKKLWKIYFFQQMTQNRLERSLKEDQGVWQEDQESYSLLPKRYCCARVQCVEKHSLEVFKGFLRTVQEVKKRGFENAEFTAMKAKVQKNLLSIPPKNPESGTLATYYADQCIFPGECPAYDFFVTASLDLIARLVLQDVHELMPNYLLDQERQVKFTMPSCHLFGKDEIQEVFNYFPTDSFILEAEDKKEDTMEGIGSNAYELLPINEEKASIIKDIVETIANTNLVMLRLKKSELESKGDEIHSVHPLRFLGVVFSDPYLKACMKKIRKSDFRWNGFFEGSSGDGFSHRMEQEYACNNLLPYVSGFSQAINADPHQVRIYIQKRDWEGLVKYLLKI